MFFYLLLLFTLVPFVELAILLWLGDHMGWLPTLLLVIATGILGASLARWQGVRTIARIQQEMAAGHVPGDALVDGLLILVAGAVLLTPGVLTDACGFALLIPPVRYVIKRSLKGWLQRNVQVRTEAFTTDWSDTRSPPRRTDGLRNIIDADAIDPRTVDDSDAN